MCRVIMSGILYSFFFFFNDTATTEIYTLSLHDALPISSMSLGVTPPSCIAWRHGPSVRSMRSATSASSLARVRVSTRCRSEEHTSELQSLAYLVCRLLLEKKKKRRNYPRLV